MLDPCAGDEWMGGPCDVARVRATNVMLRYVLLCYAILCARRDKCSHRLAGDAMRVLNDVAEAAKRHVEHPYLEHLPPGVQPQDVPGCRQQ